MRPLVFKLTTLQEVKDSVNLLNPLAFDLETKGLYGKIRLAQFYQEGWNAALLVRTPEILELLTFIKTCHIVCHNVSYEVSTIQTQLGKVVGAPITYYKQKTWEDTLLLSKLQWFNKDTFTLDACYRYALKVDPYVVMGIDKKAMQLAWGSGQPSTEKMLNYAAIDVFYLLELYNKCKSWKKTSIYQLDQSATSNALKFQCAGFHYNADKVQALIAKNLKEVKELAVPINVNSWQQVRPYIGEDQSDGLALALFALQGNDKARDVQKARKALKLNSFLNKFLDQSFEDRIYGKFTFTTKSGRGNCKDQNLQQLPRKTKVVFEAPTDYLYVMSDYAQLELRYACAYVGEQNMAKRFHKGEDLHQYTADMMIVPRQQSKTCNFNLLYGGSAKMLRNIFIEQCNLLLSLETVTDMKKKWHNLWPILTAWQQEQIKRWQRGEYFKTTLDRKFKSKLYTDAMNLPISGGSAEIAKLAMHKMCKTVESNYMLKNEVRLCNFVHDNFIWECPDKKELYEPLAEIIATAMKDAWIELIQYTKFPDLPMPVEVLVGKNQGDIDSGKEKPRYTLIK